MKVKIYPVHQKREKKLKYVIIGARYMFREWIFVRHRERSTWELPAGHIEPDENAIEAAKRELYEETGSLCYAVIPLFDYSVRKGWSKKFGRVFLADLERWDPLPEYEIAEKIHQLHLPDELTYPQIQPLLFDEIKKRSSGKIR